jgi:uncharacterized membrane protein
MPLAERAWLVPAPAAGVRLAPIDRLRGIVIILMALDHVRDFFNADALYFEPTDLTRTFPALFLTRFVTHFCAPTFVLLAGVSAYLHGKNLGDRGALARFLLIRGAWLILLDIIVVSPIWGLELGVFDLATLWAIGFRRNGYRNSGGAYAHCSNIAAAAFLIKAAYYVV